jgi:putative inorganic carbon (hco3(-)) transporter
LNTLAVTGHAFDRSRLVIAAAVGLAIASAPLAVLGAQDPAFAVTALLALAVVAVCLARVEFAVLLLVAAAPLEGAFQVGGGQLSLTKLAGGLCFASFALHAISSERRLFLDRTHAIVFGLFGLALVSTLQADDLGAAESTTIRYASFAALYLVISQFVGDERLQRRIAWVLSIACATTGVLAIENLLAGTFPQAAVLYTNQNDTAFVLATTLPLTLWLLREGGLRAAAALGMVGVIAAAVVLTFSRGALVGLAAFALWQLVIQRRRVFLLLAAAAVAAIATAAFVHSNPQEVERGLQQKQRAAETNVQKRLQAWHAATTLIEHNPILGVGPGNFASHFYDATGNPPGTPSLTVVHNAYLDVPTEMGLPAGVLFLLFVGIVFRRAMQASRRGVSPPGFAAAVEGALVVALVSSLFLSEQYFAPIWLLGALATALWRSDSPPPDGAPA